MNGNPWWLEIQIFNVAGSGDVSTFEVSPDGGKSYSPFKREWGSRWTIGKKLTGSALTFRLTSILVKQELVITERHPFPTGRSAARTPPDKNFPELDLMPETCVTQEEIFLTSREYHTIALVKVHSL